MKGIQFLLLLIPFSYATPTFPSNDDNIAVAGDLGKIRGVETWTTNTQRRFIQFKGIPYGFLDGRFEPSKLREGPLVPDDGIFEADKFGSPCPQTTGGEESCHFLNIATHNVTNVADAELKPVILFIHGAAWVAGNSNEYTGELLLKRDVVLVSFNFRLGVYGFFCLNTEEVPCNGALYDSITALQWVQKYIRYFGGDPNSVTLAGQSSGSAFVTHLLLSPLSVGLFHRAMAISGTAINEWALADDPMTSSLRVAQLSGCFTPIPGTDPNISDIANCMKNTATTNQTQIILAQDTYQAEERKAGRLGFAAVNPAVQNSDDIGIVPVLLQDRPLNILSRGEQMNIPLVLGATKHDGAFGLVLLLLTYLMPNGNLQNDPNFLKQHLIPTVLSSLGIEDDTGGLYDSISQTYLQDTRMSGNFSLMVPGLVDMGSVFFFKASSYKIAKLHSRINNSTYFYSFDFAGTRTHHNQQIIPFPDIVAHADDLIYVFPAFDFEFNEEEQRMSDALIDYWVNFATTGEPGKYPTGMEEVVPIWPKFKEENPLYLIIDKEIREFNDYPGTWVSRPADPDPGTTTPDESYESTTESGAGLSLISPTLIVFTIALVVPTVKNH